MKKVFLVSVAGVLGFLFLHLVGCSSQGTPVSTTLPSLSPTNTFTFTATPGGPTNTPTMTATTAGTSPTATSTPVTPTATPTPSGLPLFTSGGGLEVYDDTVSVYASGAAPSNLTNFDDTTIPYGSNEYCQSFGISAWNGSTWASFALSPDPGTYPSGYDLSSYTELTFYARANVAVPSGITIYAVSNAQGDAIALTTSWQSFVFDITGAAGSSTMLSVGFGTVSTPVTVYLDNVEYVQ